MFFAPNVGTYEIQEESDARSWSKSQSKFRKIVTTFCDGYDINQVGLVSEVSK